MRHRLQPLAAAVLLLLAGCASRLGAPAGPEPSASAGDVELSARANAWSGWPAELPRLVTPVRVRIANRGEVPVRVDTTTFALRLPGGGRLAAVLPADVHGVAAEPAPAALPQAGAALGPTREQSGRGWALNEPAADPRADPAQEPDRTWPLPSADMLQQALPEGVLAPGREITGFVYFQRAPRDSAAATLTWPVVDTLGETLGVAAVPLTLR
jgi:hypothetical protein